MDFETWNKEYQKGVEEERAEINRLFDKAVDGVCKKTLNEQNDEIDRKVAEYRAKLEKERDLKNGIYGTIHTT